MKVLTMTQLNLINAICGAGKTTQLVNNLSSLEHFNDSDKWIVAVPTKLMISQLHHSLHQAGYNLPISVITSSDTDLSVFLRMSQALNERNTRLILCCHKALESLGAEMLVNNQLSTALSNWNLFIDEVPDAFSTAKLTINDEFYHAWLNCVDVQDDGFYIANKDQIKHLTGMWQERCLLSTALRNNLFNLINGYPCQIHEKEIISWGHSPIVDVLKLTKSSYLAAASVERSPFVFVANQLCDVDVIKSPLFQPNELRNKHKSNRVTIKPFLVKRASKTMLDSSPQIISDMCDFVGKNIGDSYIYSCNKSLQRLITPKVKGELAPFVAHGLNTWIGVNNAAWLSVARMSSIEKQLANRLSKHTNCDGPALIKCIEDFRQQEAAYQFVMRTSLRNQASNDPVSLVVVDQYTADYLHDNYLNDATVVDATYKVPIKARKPRKAAVYICTKGAETYTKIQQLKAKKHKQREVVEILGLSLRTVKRNWKAA